MSACSPVYQRTLLYPGVIKGVGLHTGESIQCTLCPAPPNTGRILVRTDLPESSPIPMALTHLGPAHLSTLLHHGSASIQTVEHLLAALSGLGVDNCRIEVTGPELPIMDGSALPFVERILQAGTQAQTSPRQIGRILSPVTVHHQDAFVSATPAPTGLRLTYGIDFPNSPIQDQWLSWSVNVGSFIDEIAAARTFTREQDIALAREHGLIKGGSLENAIVCTPVAWHRPLRFENEPVRHKLIDLLGDLSLIGIQLQGHILAYKAGHALHHQLARQLFKAKALEITTVTEQSDRKDPVMS